MSMTFDGSTGYLESSTLAIASATYPITILAWAKVVNTTASHTIFALDSSGSGRRIMLQMDGATVGDPVIAYAFDTAGNQAQSATGFSANVWHQVIAIFTSASSRTAGIDNVLGTAQTTARSASWNRTRVGARQSGGIGSFCNGSIAELAVWDVVLSADDIAAHYKNFSARLIKPASRVMYLPGVRDIVDNGKLGIPFTTNGTVTVGEHIRRQG